MKDGSYNFNFDLISTESPNLDLGINCKKFSINDYETCGTGAISLITGLTPKYIEKHIPKSQKHWSDLGICKFLNKRGYKTAQLTKNLVTSIKSYFSYSYLPWRITNNHCLLLNSLVCENEASYFVAHKGILYHNFHETELNPLFWINRPTQTAFVVFCDKWKQK